MFSLPFKQFNKPIIGFDTYRNIIKSIVIKPVFRLVLITVCVSVLANCSFKPGSVNAFASSDYVNKQFINHSFTDATIASMSYLLFEDFDQFISGFIETTNLLPFGTESVVDKPSDNHRYNCRHTDNFKRDASDNINYFHLFLIIILGVFFGGLLLIKADDYLL